VGLASLHATLFQKFPIVTVSYPADLRFLPLPTHLFTSRNAVLLLTFHPSPDRIEG